MLSVRAATLLNKQTVPLRSAHDKNCMTSGFLQIVGSIVHCQDSFLSWYTHIMTRTFMVDTLILYLKKTAIFIFDYIFVLRNGNFTNLLLVLFHHFLCFPKPWFLIPDKCWSVVIFNSIILDFMEWTRYNLKYKTRNFLELRHLNSLIFSQNCPTPRSVFFISNFSN